MQPIGNSPFIARVQFNEETPDELQKKKDKKLGVEENQDDRVEYKQGPDNLFYKKRGNGAWKLD